MRASLSLQLSLFRGQKAKISQAVAHKSRAFLAYEAAYRRRTRGFQAPIALEDVHAEVLRSDVVYVGDYHTLRAAQEAYVELVQRARTDGRRVVLALELIEGRQQPLVDQFLAGKLSEKRLYERLGHACGGGFELWPGFRPLLRLAKEEQLEVVAIDRRSGGPRSLELRDRYAASRIARAALAPDRPRVMVLMGQYHVAPTHLPRAVRSLVRGHALRPLVVYQNCEGVWWSLARRGLAGSTQAVKIREGELCLVNSSPLLCQQSFLDYLEAEAGDAPLAAASAQERFRQMAQAIGRFAKVEVGEVLSEIEVKSPADPDVLERAQRRGGLGKAELERLRRLILSRESCYVPRAKLAYLASSSLNHAAEEAAHFVRHCAVGEAMERPRVSTDAFYARCMEEALGFFGSKVVNPARHCRSVEAWSQTFATGTGEDRQIAAFVLAHKGAELEGMDEASALLPLRPERLFHAVSHALGYLLGDALHRAFERGRITRAHVRALFKDPLEDARAVYFEWAERVSRADEQAAA